MKHGIVLTWALACAWTATAALVPVSPVTNATVQLVSDAQKQVMGLVTLAERNALFARDRKEGKKIRHDKYWRKALPVTLTWDATANEKGPWKILVGKKADLSDARVWFKNTHKTDKESGRATGANESAARVSFELERANLEIATRYYWRVATRGRCGAWNCSPRCGCAESKKTVESPIASFVTEDFAPRWIAIEGKVGNMRDLGGRLAADGRRVKQGMIYRGQGLNDNSVTGERRGRNRLTMEDVSYLAGTLGIKTDLDLRSSGETADLAASPLGPGVTFIHHSSSAYAGVFTDSGKKIMAQNFRVFCDAKNYPIYFHCIAGADRTGALGYVLNGVLGVKRQELETDWESTFYPNIPYKDGKGELVWNSEEHFNVGFGKYGDADTPWNKRIELYLLDCGVTADEIARFRAIMLP